MEAGKRNSLASAFSSPFHSKRSRMDILLNSPLRAAKAAPSEGKEKVCYFNDPIHGNIAMSGLCLEIIDTKEFQRLRDLKQLGTCDFVYPGATHSRFSHSIGVAYYAERVLRTLIKNQPELRISEKDVLCVKVAGLCHDLGHGPFSHVFDGVFMKRMHPDTKLRHEDWSVAIFKHLLHENKIDLRNYSLIDDEDLTFICEMISGTPEAERRGRPYEKFYLYDIVNNSRSGLDVDKLDYFQRDIKHTNVDTNYNQFQRFFEFGRAMQAEPIEPNSNGAMPASFSSAPASFPFGDSPILPTSSPRSLLPPPSHKPVAYMICYPEKMVGEALQLFTLRYQLHQKVYTHKSVKKVEYMLVDALELANPFIRIPGSRTASNPDGMYLMSECYKDPVAMCNLTDSVVYLIETSQSKDLEPARKLLEKIRKRQFYSCLGKVVYQRGTHIDQCTPEEIAQALVDRANLQPPAPRSPPTTSEMIVEEIGIRVGEEVFSFDYIQSQDSFAPWLPHGSQSSTEGDVAVTLQDVIVEKMHIHYGMKAENPVNRLRFYPKDTPLATCIAHKVKEKNYETLLPRVFEELAVRVFCRNPKKDMVLLKAFQGWCRDALSASPFPALSQQV